VININIGINIDLVDVGDDSFEEDPLYYSPKPRLSAIDWKWDSGDELRDPMEEQEVVSDDGDDEKEDEKKVVLIDLVDKGGDVIDLTHLPSTNEYAACSNNMYQLTRFLSKMNDVIEEQKSLIRLYADGDERTVQNRLIVREVENFTAGFCMTFVGFVRGIAPEQDQAKEHAFLYYLLHNFAPCLLESKAGMNRLRQLVPVPRCVNM